MIRTGFPFKKLFPAMRLAPALSWLLIQLSMAAMPVSVKAEAHDPKINALFEVLGTERIVLCTPDGQQVLEQHEDHVEHAECQWCQGFASAVLPTPPTSSTALRLSAVEIGFRCNAGTIPCAGLRTCHPSRAPPFLT